MYQKEKLPLPYLLVKSKDPTKACRTGSPEAKVVRGKGFVARHDVDEHTLIWVGMAAMWVEPQDIPAAAFNTNFNQVRKFTNDILLFSHTSHRGMSCS